MGDLALRPALPAMTTNGIDKVRRIEKVAATLPQVSLLTDHVLHAGMYARTIHVPAGVMITGALIKVPTVLMLHGNAAVYIGEEVPLRCVGYNVLTAAAGRKQAFVAETDICLTMIFPTDAKTVEEAEAEFTDEAALLASRRPDTPNQITVTGE